MFDVARHVGVSHQTVSRVINGSPNVSERTRVKVLAAIEELGYQQNLAAKALATGRTQTLGVLSFDSTLYGPTAMLHSIQVAARDHGYRVVLNSVDEISNAAISAGITELANSHVDGILVIGPRSTLDTESLQLSVKVPVVFREVRDGEALGVVDIDQQSAAAAATSHLTGLGHRVVAHISGPLGWVTAERRKAGWLQALAEAGLAAGPFAEGDWTPRSGYLAATELLAARKLAVAAGDPGFTGLFVANDAMALGALKAIREAGLAVPEDISVVGFDDTAESEYSNPALTTVRQDFDLVGSKMLDLLLAAVDGGGSVTGSQLVTAQLVVRDSAAQI